jgi:signal transduction histidine kinase
VLVLALLAVGGRAYALRRQVRDKLARLAATNHELKTSREELHRLNQQFQALLDGIPEYLMLVSPQMRVEWMNKAARTAVAEHVRKDGDDVAPCFREWARRSGPCAGCPVAACFASGQSQETVMQSGATVFGVKAFPIFAADGRVESVIKLAIDITEKMRRREDDDRKNRLAAIGTLAAGVAHEINNPSGLILSNLELISEAFDDAAPLLDEQFKRDGDFFFAGLPFSRMRSQLPILLKESADAARRIRQTVTDLKDFSRDGGTRDFTDFSLTTAVERSLRLTDQLLRKSTAHFSLDLAAQEITLHGNARRIEQVLVNLLANACQALPDRSRAIVLTTGYDTDLQQATIVVRDEGIGIAAEDLPKLATPFFTTRQHEGGTGLGLSVSFGIIKEHGGTIHFDSPPGKGATVTVTLPATVTKITP